MGSWQDKDGDGKVAWYPSYPGEKPAGGVSKKTTEKASVDTAPKTEDTQLPPNLNQYQTSTARYSTAAEIKAEMVDAFSTLFKEVPPKEVLAGYTKELQTLQKSRVSTSGLYGETSYNPEGVSADERKQLLNKYITAYARVKIDAAAAGDPKAIKSLQNGTFGITYTTLRNAYADNGMKFDIAQQAKAVIESSLDSNKLKANVNLINLNAKTLYPAISKQIDDGYTVKQILAPYIAKRAEVLEENPNTMDMTQLTSVAAGPNLMNLYDYEVSLRNDPKWAFTKNAKDSLSTVATGIARMFGLVG